MFRIRDGSGSVDPYYWIKDPNRIQIPLFFQWLLREDNKKIFFLCFFYCYLLQDSAGTGTFTSVFKDNKLLKVLTDHSNWEATVGSFDPYGNDKLEARQFFYFILKEHLHKISK